MKEMLILVDENDNPIGYEEKLKVHQDGGKLHRAFSIFIINSNKEMLLQLRSVKKYHFGGLWTNACCSHGKRGESLEDSIHRELKEEVGFDTELKDLFTFIYRANDKKSGLTEHELDHVIVGVYDGKVTPDPEEVDDFKWINIDELKKDVIENPDKYSPWFKLVIDRVIDHIENNRI